MHFSHHTQGTLPSSSGRSGMALIITLAMLVLLSAIVVAFFSTVKVDVSASKSYEGGVQARMLADSALNLVIGEIRDASTQPNQAWISQPGLVRTYNATGAPLKAYKLYSSDQMVVDGTGFDPANNPDDVPTDAGWRTQTALWTDLNSPVTDTTRHDANGKPLMTYPILDGNHLYSTQDPSGQTVGGLSLTQIGKPDIQGFEVLKFDKNHPAEMPVRWLYILRDGTVVPASQGSSSSGVKLAIPSGKEKTPEGEPNEPVARVAYWTDDETAKVNLNTASEGTFWDTPICNTGRTVLLPKPPLPGQVDPNMMYEMDLAEYIPDQHEYQRYPGHPATTSLSPIFGQQLTKLFPARPDMIEAIYEMSPRVTGYNYTSPTAGYSKNNDYSSDGGTKRGGRGIVLAGDNTAYPISIDNDRLYASIDELLFTPMFGNATTPNQRIRQSLAPQSSTGQGSDNSREMLEMAKFFLTCESRAPEQNLFNKPRVAIWPVDASKQNHTTYDNTIAFCSTVPVGSSGPLPFIFTRSNAASPTADYAGQPRNQAIYSYLHSLMGTQFPGYALPSSQNKTFATKYGADSDQILTEIFDYIRCTNLIDMTLPASETYTNKSDQDANTQLTKRGQVVPITIGGTRGIGRIATVSELAIVFAGLSNATAQGGQSAIKVEAALVPQLFCPMAGFSALANDIRIHFSKIDITVIDPSGNPIKPFPTKQPDIYDVGRITDIEDGESKVGGYIGARSLLEGSSGGRYPLDIGSPADSVPPTGEFTITAAKGAMMSFYGSVTAQIFAPNTATTPTQTIVFNFGSAPGIKVPIPPIATGTTGTPFATGPGASTKTNTRCSGQFNGMVNTSTDTVRSSCPVGGNGINGGTIRADMRLIAAMGTVGNAPNSTTPVFIIPQKQASQTSVAAIHSMRPCYSAQGGMYPGFQSGSLVASLPSTSYTGGQWDLRPGIPVDVPFAQNALGAAGDWDNGPHFILDGAYCNKADEGARRHEHGRSQASGQYDEDAAPYIGWQWNPQDSVTEQTTFFSPNRQIASPVTFGSLPTGVIRGLPWQTLLFRPAKTYLPGGANHPGSSVWGPPDHLLLDLFWMPVVEPYPISEPFSTAGKINLNAQVVPFTNIVRTTGLRAVLQSVKMAALNPNQPDTNGKPFIQNYKVCGSPGAGGGAGGGYGIVIRRNVDVDNTIRQITDRLNRNKPFISASEICDIPLIPADLQVQGAVNAGITGTTPVGSFDSALSNFWRTNSLTGDNTLERPYSYIYPRITTRSNTYTVHVRVQTLKQVKRNAPSDDFIDGKDQITGDFRGSFVIERYLDPNSAGFYKPDGTPTDEKDPSATLGPYRFRVVSSKQFAP